MPGVHAVYTAPGPDRGRHPPDAVPTSAAPTTTAARCRRPQQMALATDKVRYVGDPVAVVVADTAKQAKDAAEAVVVDIDALPAVTEARDAAAPGAPQLYDEVPGNVVLDWQLRRHGEGRRGVRRAPRTSPSSRSATAASSSPRWSRAPRSPTIEDGRYVFRVGCQGVFGMRNAHQERARRAAGEGPRADRQCRRQLRHEGVAAIPNMSASCTRPSSSAAR